MGRRLEVERDGATSLPRQLALHEEEPWQEPRADEAEVR